ncbi:MAG: hypothetical protein AAFN10_22100 [Bacteroidota bacterium]
MGYTNITGNSNVEFGKLTHMEELKRNFDQLLAKGDLKGALDVLGQAAPDKSNEIILTQARLSGLNQNIRLGIISHSDAQINKNQIAAAINSIAADVFQGVMSANNGTRNTGSRSSGVGKTNEPTPSSEKPQIYLSYSWGDEEEEGTSREEIVNQMSEALRNAGYNIIRDKDDKVTTPQILHKSRY